jgi:hypothetical protein
MTSAEFANTDFAGDDFLMIDCEVSTPSTTGLVIIDACTLEIGSLFFFLDIGPPLLDCDAIREYSIL